MNYDVYLGGLAEKEWREYFKEQVSDDLEIFDPLTDKYTEYSDAEKANQAAMEFFHIENGATVITFYLNSSWNGTTSLLEIGDAVGGGKQVIVCLDGEVPGKQKIEQYCDFRGALVVKSLDELIAATETCLSEVELCSFE